MSTINGLVIGGAAVGCLALAAELYRAHIEQSISIPPDTPCAELKQQFSNISSTTNSSFAIVDLKFVKCLPSADSLSLE